MELCIFFSAPFSYLNRGIHLGFREKLASMEIPRNPQGQPHLGQLLHRKINSQNSVTKEKNWRKKTYCQGYRNLNFH